MNKKIALCLFILFVVGMLWKLYPRMLVAAMFPSDEYINIGYVLYLVKHAGNPFDAFHNPHLGYFLVYFISLITKIEVHQIMFSINPIIAGLTVVPFFLFASKILNNKKQALIASVFFTFSETMFYRTCHYGSNEALGLFLMFTYLAMYLNFTNIRRKLLSIPILILIPFAHLLPFIFAIVFTTLDLFLKKRKIVVLGLIIASVLFIFNPIFPPHRFVASVFSGNLSTISLEKIFLFSFSEIIRVVPFFMGLTAMLVLCLFSYKKSSKLEKSLLLLMLFSIPLSLLLYSTRMVGPTRLLLYVSIPLFIMTARILDKKKCVVILITFLMVMSPLIGGINRFTWVSDSITQNEIEAIEFLSSQGFFDSKKATYWYGDLPVRQYFSTYCGSNIVYNPTPIGYYSHIFLSERMEKQGFFLEPNYEGGRSIEIRRPIIDIWARNETGWKDWYYEQGMILRGWIQLEEINNVNIYELYHVKVYEAVIELVR